MFTRKEQKFHKLLFKGSQCTRHFSDTISLQFYLALLHLEGSLNIIDFVKDVGEFSLNIYMEGNEI